MPQLDLVRELTFAVGAAGVTLAFAAIYAGLETMIPFLRGGLGRV